MGDGMIDAPLALAFTTGMIVTVNPCGFAMLPAYLSFFVGADDDREPSWSVARALLVGPAVTVGFVSAFAVLGLLVGQVTSTVYQVTPWVSIVIGIVLAVVGLAFVVGFDPTLRLPRLERGGRSRSLPSMALFGVSYAVCSVGCTLPLFIATMSGNFGRGFASGVAYFLAYAAGFGLVVTTLTVAVALAKGSAVAHVRRVLPYVHRIAGGLLVLTGLYVAHYGWVEIQQGRTQSIPNSPLVDRVSRWSSLAQNWILDRSDLLPWLLVAIVAGGITVAWLLAGPPHAGQQAVSEQTADVSH